MKLVQFLSQHALSALELSATAAYALSGVLVALRKRMDIVGICVIGWVAAFGGGTLRDVLLDRRPFFWVEHQSVLVLVLVISLAGATLWQRERLERKRGWLQIPDTIGLGLFCATGTHLSWTLGQPPLVAVLMGIITGTFGGVLRDLLSNEIPDLFRDHQPYALCAAAGGASYIGLSACGAPTWLGLASCALLASGLRALALGLNQTLPPIGHRAYPNDPPDSAP